MRLPLIILVFTLSSFSAWGQSKATTVGSEEQAVQRAAGSFVEAFNNLEWERFRNTFAYDATVFFPADVPSRANGRDEIEARFRPMFEEDKKRGGGPPYLHILPKDMKIQMAGDAAIMTFHLQGTGAVSRRTIVWQKRGGKWLIVHLHASRIVVAASDATAQARIEKNVVYGMYSGLALLMDVHHPEKPNGYGVVFVSGSGWQPR